MKSLCCRVVLIGAALLLLLTGHALGAGEFGDMHDANRVLVKFKKFPSQRRLRNFAISHNLQLDRTIPRIGVFRFRIPEGQKARTVVKRLIANDLIEFAEPDRLRFAAYEPNDPMFPSQWDMALMNMPACWDLEKGQPDVVIAVLDTGIDLDHPDLVDQLWVNPGEIPGNGIDDDGNGYVDDINGYDFAGDGLLPLPAAEDPIPDDIYVGHGSHVSGTIAAEQDNSEGITGIAPGAKLMAVRVLGGRVGIGYTSDLAEGIVYATDNGANVINLSLGGTDRSLTEYNALKYAWNHNVFIAAASGNEAQYGNPIVYPAGYVFAMSVAATNSSDNVATFSTHNEFVEVSAPGVNILSTVLGGFYESVGWSGTSMATPHVAGLAALLYSTYSGIQNWQVRWMLQAGNIDLAPAGWDEFSGFGRADCEQLLAVPPPPTDVLKIISPPEGIQFTFDALIALLWNPVEGASSYRIRATPPGGGTMTLVTTDTYYTRHPLRPLASGNYDVTVEALDAGGAVISSDTVSFSKQ